MNHQSLTDRAAIGLSFLCTLHCLATPILIATLPSLAALSLDSEAFHLWMLVAVLPISLFALVLGCRKHKNYQVLGLGFAGLAVMVAAVVFGHDYLGEMGEKTMTVTGAGLVALGHFLNQRLCQKQACDSHD